MNHIEVIEGFEVAITVLLQKVSICKFYAGIYIEVSLVTGPAEGSLQLLSMVDSACNRCSAGMDCGQHSRERT